MIVRNHQILFNVPFDEYLKLPGVSHSDIKNEGKSFSAATAHMQLGTHVHNYLLEPEKYNHDNISIVRPAAIAVKNKLGVLWQYLQPEVTVLSDFIHNGFVMRQRSRIDLGIPDRLVVDIKVSKVPLGVSIPRFGYDHQLNGYRCSFGAKIALLLRIDPDTCGRPGIEPLIEIYNVPPSTQWWDWQIVQRGKPLNNG